MPRTVVSSGSPYEDPIGFSRAVRVGPILAVSGTAPIGDDGETVAPGDAYAQAKRCLAIIEQAVADAGGSLEDVIRTRVFLTDAAVWQDVGQAHGAVFGDVRPAATMVEVAGLLDDDWLVEIEADAVVASAADAWR